jgi:hypothetical protein
VTPARQQHSQQETIMPAHSSRQRSHLRAAARMPLVQLRRIAAALAVVVCGLLAPAAVVPAASAAILIPNPHWAGRLAVLPSVPPPAIRVVAAGGMAGWQITLIAAGAAVAAATAAVALDRALAARRTGQAPGR